MSGSNRGSLTQAVEQGWVVVIGGPTASGKSGMALDLAQSLNGTVINADSMQLYAELDVLTARPPAEDLKRAPHRLYGVLPASERGSAAKWRDMALAEIDRSRQQGRLPVVVGGTGLYIRALIQGLSAVPAIPDEIRAAAHARLQELGGEAFRLEVITRDPAATKLNAGDTTRLTRAWEVAEATGRPLSQWQAEEADGPPDNLRFTAIVIDPPRESLYANCEQRFRMMMERGALDEVRQLVALGLDPSLPAMKALGVPELGRYLAGEITLATAIDEAERSTRRYAKRQMTWFRHQLAGRAPSGAMHGSYSVPLLYSDANYDEILHHIETSLRV